jgi:tripartite-type tricarboxylate transporter receptor subunit TctC
MMAAAKAKPGILTVSHSGIDVYAALLNDEAGIKLLDVPYKGGAPAVIDAMGGQVSMSMGQPPAVLQELRAGKLKPIGITSKERLPALPNVPTFRESGAPNVDLFTWFAVFAPRGTPGPVIARLADASKQVVNDPAFRTIASLGLNLDYQTPDQLRSVVSNDLIFWRKVAKTNPGLVHSN